MKKYFIKVFQQVFLQKNLLIANKKLISKLFIGHSSGDKRRNEGKKNSINFVIKLNDDDGCLREASQHVINARVSSCKQTLFGGINLTCMI